MAVLVLAALLGAAGGCANSSSAPLPTPNNARDWDERLSALQQVMHHSIAMAMEARSGTGQTGQGSERARDGIVLWADAQLMMLRMLYPNPDDEPGQLVSKEFRTCAARSLAGPKYDEVRRSLYLQWEWADVVKMSSQKYKAVSATAILRKAIQRSLDAAAPSSMDFTPEPSPTVRNARDWTEQWLLVQCVARRLATAASEPDTGEWFMITGLSDYLTFRVRQDAELADRLRRLAKDLEPAS